MKFSVFALLILMLILIIPISYARESVNVNVDTAKYIANPNDPNVLNFINSLTPQQNHQLIQMALQQLILHQELLQNTQGVAHLQDAPRPNTMIHAQAQY